MLSTVVVVVVVSYDSYLRVTSHTSWLSIGNNLTNIFVSRAYHIKGYL